MKPILLTYKKDGIEKFAWFDTISEMEETLVESRIKTSEIMDVISLKDSETITLSEDCASRMIRDNMKCICIENEYGNSNFTKGKSYEIKEETGIRCNFGNMWCDFDEREKPNSFCIGDTFKYAMCVFQISELH